MQSLKWSVISFTEKGAELAEKIKRLSKEQQLPSEIHTYHGRKQVENLNAWTKEQFSLRNVILFIGACGIAVRTIAPFLKDKLTDSPVLVLDEAGNYVIPLLSGHVGGANEIALLLAELLGAVPVITTATDINNAFAIDVFAKKHDLSIDKKEGIKKVSAKVLEKKKLSMTIAPEYAAKVDVAIGTPEDGQKPEPLLTLIPKEYILGIGCRRNKEEQELKAFAESCLKEAGVDWKQIYAVPAQTASRTAAAAPSVHRTSLRRRAYRSPAAIFPIRWPVLRMNDAKCARSVLSSKTRRAPHRLFSSKKYLRCSSDSSSHARRYFSSCSEVSPAKYFCMTESIIIVSSICSVSV